MTDGKDLTCTCGRVVIRVEGRPIVSVECLCSDCQRAGALLAGLSGAPRVLDDKGATPFVLYRKDRVRCVKGADLLREHRLTERSKTRRAVASCCNTPVFLDFAHGHWLSVYGSLWPAGALPRLDLRTMTRDAPDGVVLSRDVANPRTHTLGFYARLFRAWAAMGFRTPEVDYVKGALDAR
jgi:hypothetical protein